MFFIRGFRILGLLAVAVAATGLLLAPAKAAKSATQQAGAPTVVVLTATWCGTCREITPAVQRAIQESPELGLHLVTLDVDNNASPGAASAYGISIAGGDMPQVFLFNNGKTVLLFSGKGYRFGQSKQVEAQIREALQSSF